MGFPDKAAAAISIIGGADGPTSIFLAGKLGQTNYLGPIAVAAYSYMSLVPIIQPPIMKLLTTEKERKIKMEQLRPVSKLEKILFPIIVTIVVVLILPTTAPLVGMLMLGNLFRESGVVKQLTETASNALMYIVVIILGTSVGATTSAEAFFNLDTLKIVALGLIAFGFGTAAGVIFGKIMCKATHGKVNPLIGSAGVSAVPMAARVSQKVGSGADPSNFLLMHAMAKAEPQAHENASVAPMLSKEMAEFKLTDSADHITNHAPGHEPLARGMVRDGGRQEAQGDGEPGGGKPRRSSRHCPRHQAPDRGLR